MLYTVGAIAVVVFFVALLYAQSVCKRSFQCHCNCHTYTLCKRGITIQYRTVDDQKYGAVLIYFMQIVDLYSDVILAIQVRIYIIWCAHTISVIHSVHALSRVRQDG